MLRVRYGKIHASGISVLARLTQRTNMPGLRRFLAAYVAFSAVRKVSMRCGILASEAQSAA